MNNLTLVYKKNQEHLRLAPVVMTSQNSVTNFFGVYRMTEANFNRTLSRIFDTLL